MIVCSQERSNKEKSISTASGDNTSSENYDMSPPHYRLKAFSEGKGRFLGSNQSVSHFSKRSYNNLSVKCEQDQMSCLKQPRSTDAVAHYAPFSLYVHFTLMTNRNTTGHAGSNNDVACLDSCVDIVEVCIFVAYHL